MTCFICVKHGEVKLQSQNIHIPEQFDFELQIKTKLRRRRPCVAFNLKRCSPNAAENKSHSKSHAARKLFNPWCPSHGHEPCITLL